MAKMLMNLRFVPDDEADEVRELLDGLGADWYEIPPGRFGISGGGFWIRDESDFERVKAAYDEYQARRTENARTSAERRSFLDLVRADPLKVIGYVLLALFILAVFIAPVWELMD